MNAPPTGSGTAGGTGFLLLSSGMGTDVRDRDPVE